jgi:hypothetical protein
MSRRWVPDVARPNHRAYLLLTRLFLRQFLENDLSSPDGDRSQMLAVLGASAVSLTLFISMFMSAGYAMSIMMPGQAAVLTLSDKFFYISLAMLATGMVAASQWDALSLDQRDIAILQPLPVRPAMLRLAKLSAVAALGGGVALGVNVFPTFIFPWMLGFAVPQMAAGQLLWLMIVHLTITVTAAVFGFLVVIALRESFSALLGATLFGRVSPWLQTSVIVLLGIALLLIPIATTRVGQRGFEGWRLMLPSTAFVGASETATQGFLDDLPRRRMTVPQENRDRAFSAIYAERRPLFPGLARRAQWLFLSLLAIVAAATALNAFRTPVPTAAVASGRRHSRFAWLSRLVFPRSAAARAGFDFALATMWRNKTHRLTLAVAAAVGVAMVFFALSRVDLTGEALSVRLLVTQPMLYGSLLMAFRHMVRVPAELRANWGIQIAWRGQASAFANGVQGAAMLTLAVPAIAIAMLPVAAVGGPALAAAHAAIGLLGAAIVVEALMLSYDKVPFTCTYVPDENIKGIAPLLVIGFLIGATLFAQLELRMLAGGFAVKGGVGLAILFIVLRVISMRRTRSAQIDFNEGPPGLHSLGLHS